jgi:O-antigen/teichoic acid export membrane protein
VYGACQWGLLIVLARLGSPETVGEFAFGLAVTAPVMMLANMDLRAAQATDACREYQFGDYLGLRLVTTAAALSVMICLVLGGGYGWETAAIILVLGLAKAWESLGDVFHGLLQQRERMDRIAISIMLKGIASLVLTGLVFYLTGNVIWSLLVLAASWSVVVLVYDMPGAAEVLGHTRSMRAAWRAKELRPQWRPATLARLALYAAPLGLVMFLISINTNTPRYFVESRLGLHELGLFSAVSYLGLPGSMTGIALGHAAYSRLSMYYATRQRRAYGILLLKLLASALLLGGCGVLIAVIAGQWLLDGIYGPEYAEQAVLLTWMMAAAAVSYLGSMLNFGMTAARFFFVQAPLYLAVAGITFLSCLVLIPQYGLNGGALALLAAGLFQLLGASIILVVILTRNPRS